MSSRLAGSWPSVTENARMVPAEWKARLASCLSREAVVEVLESSLLSLFDGERARIFSLDDLPRVGVRDNPVTRTFLVQETALHEAHVVDNATWRRLCPRADHGHVLVGPLVRSGRLAGVLAVTRNETRHPFGASEIRLMNSLSLYGSTRMAELDSRALPIAWSELSPRESEVAGFVRQGLRNAEIAQRLSLSEHTVKQNLKSVFRKLGLRSRTELAVHHAHGS